MSFLAEPLGMSDKGREGREEEDTLLQKWNMLPSGCQGQELTVFGMHVPNIEISFQLCLLGISVHRLSIWRRYKDRQPHTDIHLALISTIQGPFKTSVSCGRCLLYFYLLLW